jgi:hypothetical protein
MKNYTSLEKMKASDVAPSFTEEKVTAETFKEEVAKGTLYKGFEPPKDATMLKFRYYSPDGTLIEQNNVPVVYDGTGVESVKTYYLLTDKSSGITLASTGWNEKPQTVTKDKRFLWTYIKTIYTNSYKTCSCTDPCITAVFGEQGERGAMYLGHYKDNQEAYEANKPAVFDGDYYLNTTDSYLYDYHKESNNWTPIKDFTDYRYNQSINDIFAAIENSDDVKKFIKAKKIWVQHIAAAVARVETLYSNVIKLVQGTDLSDDKIKTGGLIQSANYDGTITNGAITKAGSKGWAIDYSGKAEFNNVTVRGTVDGSEIKGSTINGGTIKIGKNFSVDKDGNIIANKATLNDGILKNMIVKKSLIIEGESLATPTINPYVTAQPLCGGTRAMIWLMGGKIKYKTNNVESITKLDTGIYLVKFNTFACWSIAFGYFSYGATSKLPPITVDPSVNSTGKVPRITRNMGIITDYDYVSGEASVPYKIIECRDFGNSLRDFTNNVLDFAFIWFQY